MASSSMPSLRLYHRLAPSRHTSNNSAIRRKCFSESWTLYSLLDLVLLCIMINLLSIDCNSFLLHMSLIICTIGPQLCISAIFATRLVFSTLEPMKCDSWLLVAPLIWIILIAVMTLSPRSLSIHLIGNKFTESVYHYPPYNEYISALFMFCSYNSSKQSNIQHINAVNYYLQSVFHHEFSTQFQDCIAKELGEMMKLHRNTLLRKGIELNQIVPKISTERNEDYLNAYHCTQWMQVLYFCFPLQVIINIVYLSSSNHSMSLNTVLLMLLLIYIWMECVCYKGHMNRYRLVKYSSMILPELSTKCVMDELQFKETFESIDEMIENLHTVYEIMFEQKDTIHYIMDTVPNHDIASLIAQFLWIPLPHRENMDNMLPLFRSLDCIKIDVQ